MQSRALARQDKRDAARAPWPISTRRSASIRARPAPTSHPRHAASQRRRATTSAIADLNQAIGSTRRARSIYIGAASRYYAKQDYDRAIADFNEAIRPQSDLRRRLVEPSARPTPSRRNKGRRHRRLHARSSGWSRMLRRGYRRARRCTSPQGEHDRAIADFSEVVRLDPKAYAGFMPRGNSYRDKGELDRAIADYSESIRLQPDLSYAYYERGVAYRLKGDREHAIADFARRRARLRCHASTARRRRGAALAGPRRSRRAESSARGAARRRCALSSFERRRAPRRGGARGRC